MYTDTVYGSSFPSYEDYLKAQSRKMPDMELGRTEFLNLLVKALQYQDPLEPQKDTDFVAQLATFNMLQQMEDLNKTILLHSSYGMVGKFAVATYYDENNLEITVAGVIDRVFMKDNVIYAQIGDHIFEASRITDVFDINMPDQTNMAMLSMLENMLAHNLVGKTVVVDNTQPEEIANPDYNQDLADILGEMYDEPKTIPNPNYDPLSTGVFEGKVTMVFRGDDGVVYLQIEDADGQVRNFPASSVLQVKDTGGSRVEELLEQILAQLGAVIGPVDDDDDDFFP